MAKKEQKRQDRAQVWGPRITAAQEYYERWERKFQVKDLESAYLGFQWEDCEDEEIADGLSYRAYVMNMFFSSIDVKMPSLLFNEPVYSVSPRPGKIDFDPKGAVMRARLKEDALNYFVQGGIKNFSDEIEMAILDAFARFGVIEVGYTADYVLNPDVGKPFLVSDTTVATDKNGKVIKQPEFLPEEERIYVRRIHAERFRVGGVDQSNLERCSWYGYVDFIRKEDLLASAKVNQGYNINAIENATGCTPDSKNWKYLEFEKGLWDHDANNDIVPVWKIYDLRAKEFLMLSYDASDIIYSEEFIRPRHFALRFRKQLKGWYPLPFTFNWISPQAEVNETREAARIHRRRFQRKFVVMEGAFEEKELDKLQNGGDGVFAMSKRTPQEAVHVVQMPNLTGQHDQAVITSRDDFNIISGTSAEQRGQSDRTTATQSQIKERRSEIRESRDKILVANWLRQIGKEILMTAKEEMVLPFWVKLTADTPGLFSEVQAINSNYDLITTDEFGDEDFEVNIKVSSLSPVDQQLEKNNMVEFLSIVSQYPEVAMSPTMVYEVADRTGFRNERAIAEYAQRAQLMYVMQIMQLAAQTGQDPMVLMVESFMRNAQPGEQNPVAQRSVAQMTPPDMESIQNQVSNQLTQPQV